MTDKISKFAVNSGNLNIQMFSKTQFAFTLLDIMCVYVIHAVSEAYAVPYLCGRQMALVLLKYMLEKNSVQAF